MEDNVETEILNAQIANENGEEEISKELINLIEEVDQEENDNAEKIDCVYKVIGNFGPYHMRFFIYYTVVYFISAFHNIGIVFYAARNNFWCKDLNVNLTESEHQMIINKCVPNCKEYDYDRSLVHTTIVTEFDLICDKAWFVSASGSVYQFGYAISSILVGYMSDTYGRKLTYKAMVYVEIISGLGQALAPNIYIFLISRCVLGIAAFGRFLTGNLLIIETAGPNKRALLSTFVEFGWYVGEFLLILSFYLISNYRYIQLMITAFEISSLFYFNLIPESIRWLLTKERYTKAKEILFEAANLRRKKKFSPKELNSRIDSLIEHFKLKKLEQSEASSKPKNKGFLLFKLWRTKGMFKICICLYILCFTNSLTGYSTTFNSTDFGDNIYINIGVFAFAKIIANLLLTLTVEKFRRLRIAKLSYLFMFITLLMLTISFYQEDYSTNLIPGLNQQSKTIEIKNTSDYISNNYKQLKQNAENLNMDIKLFLNEGIFKEKVKNDFRLWIGIIFKFCSKISFQMGFIICFECFPTIIRQFSMGTCSIASRFASVVSPFTRELSNKFGTAFTFGTFSSLSLLSFCVCFILPETYGKEIPNTLEDCAELNLERKKNKKKAIKNLDL